MINPQQEIKKIWYIKALGPKSVLELRAINPSSKPITKIFSGTSFASTDALKLAFENENVRKFIDGKEVKKIIIVPDKLVNIVLN